MHLLWPRNRRQLAYRAADVTDGRGKGEARVLREGLAVAVFELADGAEELVDGLAGVTDVTD